MWEMDRRSRPLMGRALWERLISGARHRFHYIRTGTFCPVFSGLSGGFFLIFLFPAVRYDKEKKLMKEAQSWKFKK